MIPGTSWLARLSRCAIDPTMERFSRTAQFFSRALAQLHVKAGVYIYALENAGGHRVDLFEGDRAWSSGVTHARFSCLKKRPFPETHGISPVVSLLPATVNGTDCVTVGVAHLSS